MSLPKCACGGELRPPLKLWTDEHGKPRAVPDVTEEEEAIANRYEDAAIVQCGACWTRVVLTAERPERYRRNNPVPDQSVFE